MTNQEVAAILMLNQAVLDEMIGNGDLNKEVLIKTLQRLVMVAREELVYADDPNDDPELEAVIKVGNQWLEILQPGLCN